MIDSVTVAMLVYKNSAWLDFALEGLGRARNHTPFRTLVVGCDAHQDVVCTGRLDVDYRSEDPNEYYINRVYRAWNTAVEAAETKHVVLINSDMYVSDYWLDALVGVYMENSWNVPCSLLVESGRIESAMPEYVRDFGVTPQSFNRSRWRDHAYDLRMRSGTKSTEPGRLFMPVLFNRSMFLHLGGYPHGNVGDVSGDKLFFSLLQKEGCRHVTALRSIVYHVQEGEMRDNR